MGHDILKTCLFWLRMQTLKTMILTATQQYLNEIDTPETSWNYNDYLIWMDCGTLLNPLKGHGSWCQDMDHPTKKTRNNMKQQYICLFDDVLCLTYAACGYLQKSLPLSLKSDILTFLARHLAARVAVTWVLHKIFGNMICFPLPLECRIKWEDLTVL